MDHEITKKISFSLGKQLLEFKKTHKFQSCTWKKQCFVLCCKNVFMSGHSVYVYFLNSVEAWIIGLVCIKSDLLSTLLITGRQRAEVKMKEEEKVLTDNCIISFWTLLTQSHLTNNQTVWQLWDDALTSLRSLHIPPLYSWTMTRHLFV